MNLPDSVALEMRMAQIMTEQETSGFRFDVSAAERVRGELEKEQEEITAKLLARFIYVPGKVFTPKRGDKKKGYVAGASMTRLLDFNPTSRQHIAWALQNFSSARFTKVTNTGKPRLMRRRYLRCVTVHFSKATPSCMKNVKCLLGF